MPRTPPPPPDELAEQTALADAGEATGVFLHELGNLLNNLLLSARLLQRQLPEEFQPRLVETCQLITETAGQMQQLAKYRQLQRIEPYPVDLNALATEVATGASNVQLECADSLPKLPATRAEIKRIVRLLIANAHRAHDDMVRMHTWSNADHLGFTIEYGGPIRTAEQMQHYFEPFSNVRGSENNLELAMAKNVVRRLGGQLQAEALPEGGVRLIASWPRTRR